MVTGCIHVSIRNPLDGLHSVHAGGEGDGQIVPDDLLHGVHFYGAAHFWGFEEKIAKFRVVRYVFFFDNRFLFGFYSLGLWAFGVGNW